MKTEPLLSIGAIVALVLSVIGLMRAFGIGVTIEQEGAVVEFVKSSYEIVIVLAGFAIARGFVYSRESVEKLTGVSDPVVPAVPSVSPPVTNVA